MEYPFIISLHFQVKVDFNDAMQKCFETLQIGMDIQTMIQSVIDPSLPSIYRTLLSLRSCMVTHESARLQEAAAARTTNVYPDKHDHVPWVLFNNASLAGQLVTL